MFVSSFVHFIEDHAWQILIKVVKRMRIHLNAKYILAYCSSRYIIHITVLESFGV